MITRTLLSSSLAVAATLASSLASPLAAHEPASPEAEKAPMSARDLITMPRLGSPTVTKYGRYVVYSVTYTDEETLKRSPKHYVLDLGRPGSAPVEFDLGLRGHSLEFGPDNFLYFVSSEHTDEDAETRSRVWRVALEGNGNVTGAMLVADIAGTDIAGFKLAPSGDKIALWAEIDRNCQRFGCEAKPEPTGSGRLYDGDGGFYRHWDRWIDPDLLSRVFVFGLEDGKVVGDGVAADGGMGIGNTPTQPFGGSEDIAWAPDGSGLYFVARRSDSKEPTSTDLDIYFSDLSGDAPKELTAANEAHDSTPVPSPDGKSLAYLAMERAGYESDRMVVHLRDLASGDTRALTADTDLSFGSLTWSEDGSYLLATATDVLDVPAYRIDPKSGEVTELNLMAGNEAHIGNVTPLVGDRLLFTRDSIGVPAELFLARMGQTATPITNVVTSRMGNMATTVTTRFSFEGAGGDTVWGQITKLEEHDGEMPAILYIHGGPQGSFLDGWSSRWNPRVLASQGYAVISVDFHGSAGYGQEFMDAINQDWGGKPLEDLQKGLAAALKLDPQIDGERACAMGASYGGYMVNWIAGNWPDRFDCLVQHDGLFDMRSFYYSTEELWFPRWDFGGSYSENAEVYEKWNPVNHIDKWQTPMLVITGEQDFRVPYTQGLQSFTVLQEREIPSQLLVFPDENHWVLGAANSLQWHETVFAWLDRWLKPRGDKETSGE
ncbi:S9 family peptidase [Erythrobacter sp. SCSIO 43205]|uniref:alpha/beta hydrolase family protein n=1 Tax=Erythrobacter sp. SCSIO 43205 TaxID=2779361 RepID=UPI001CA9052C|nr:S9 family peptidase [Erythrobacter sp. SCSIO 43205]UAB78457.1 S9 family peptidase [Erythrobacter sp. SCSIO 43205]